MSFSKFSYFILFSAASSAALANQATLISKSPQPITVVYRIAHKNPGQPTVYSSPQTVMISNSTVVPFDLNGYQLGGIVPVSINGISIPASVTEFGVPQKCSLATDKAHPAGEMTFVLKQTAPHHGQLSCSVQGGISQ